MDAAPPAEDFSVFSPLLRQVAAQGVLRRYKRGVILMQEGEPGGTLFFLLSGQLRAYHASEDGREFTFGYYGAGQVLGEMSLDGGPRSANVSVEKQSLCSFVDRLALETCIAREPKLAFELLGLVARRARDATCLATELAQDKVYDRLARFLRVNAVPEADGKACQAYPLTQEQMAGLIGCGRPMLSKLLRDLVKGDYLRQEQRPQGRVWVTLKPLPTGW